MQDWLGTWIAREHLAPEAIREHRRRFASRAGPYVVLDGFLPEPLAREVSSFLCREARYRQTYGLYHGGDECSREEWLAAEPKRRFYAFKVLDEGQWQSPSPAAESYLRVRRAFADPRAMRYFAGLTGLELGEGTEVGTHGMTRDDALYRHRDLGHDRQLAFLLYLTPDWREADGGALCLLDERGEETVVVPRYNRLLAFDVVANRGHWVQPVTAAAGSRMRVSLGGWLHRPSSRSA